MSDGETKMADFWDVALCSLVETNRRFRGSYCIHDHDDMDHMAISIRHIRTSIVQIIIIFKQADLLDIKCSSSI
jgi:hypothetical protein